MPRRRALTGPLRDTEPAERLRAAARVLAIGGEVRSVLPEAPRRPVPDDLLFLARSVVRDAARAEFVREGLDAIDLPEDFRRADLQRADLLADREHLAFLDRTLAVIEVTDPAPDPREAGRVARSATSRDAYGLTLEAASVIASYLVGAAERLERRSGTGPGELLGHDAYVAEQSRALRDAARETLGSLVTAPQELRAAMALRASVLADPAAGGPAPEDGASAGTADPDTQPGAARSSAASGSAQQAHPSAGRTTTDGSRAGRGTGRSDERWRPSDLRRMLDHADAARAFFETDAGRGAVKVLRTGAALVAERAARRGEADDEGRSGDRPRDRG